MTMEEMRFWWQLVVTLIALASAVFAWYGRRSNVTNATITDINSALALLSSRVTVVEQAQRHAPNADDMTAIREEISRVAEGVANLSGKFSGELGAVTRQLQLIQQHLLQSK